MKNPPVVRKLEIRYRDLDTLGHVNNAVYLEYFEEIRFAYWWKLAAEIGVTEFVGGDIEGAQYVLAETSVRFRKPIEFTDDIYGAGRTTRIGNRSYGMEYEIRAGDSYESGETVATGDVALVFFDPKSGKVKPRPDWFLSAVAQIESRPEDAFL